MSMPRSPRKSSRFAASYRRAYQRPADAPVYRCQCGCDEEIPWRPSHRTRQPRFIQAHYLRDGTSLRIQKLREAKLAARVTPPSGWVAPSGVCACGCGKATRIANATRRERDEYCGYPRRWVQGHAARAMMSKRGADHPRWTGGRYAEHMGYIRVHMPSHPTANRDGYMLEHRYVYETSRGILLPPSVAVHHINGDKSDNRPDNLIATTRAAHVKVHMRAGQVISLFLDDRLLAAARAHVRAHGELPDLSALTQAVYGAHATPPAPA